MTTPKRVKSHIYKIQNSDPGLTVEHVLLSVHVISNKESAGQFDDSIAHLIEKYLSEYRGVLRVDARVFYNHTKLEQHINGCDCGWCRTI